MAALTYIHISKRLGGGLYVRLEFVPFWKRLLAGISWKEEHTILNCIWFSFTLHLIAINLELGQITVGEQDATSLPDT